MSRPSRRLALHGEALQRQHLRLQLIFVSLDLREGWGVFKAKRVHCWI